MFSSVSVLVVQGFGEDEMGGGMNDESAVRLKLTLLLVPAASDRRGGKLSNSPPYYCPAEKFSRSLAEDVPAAALPARKGRIIGTRF